MVISPQLLWKDFDRQLMPLEVFVISESSTPAYTQKLVYFNGQSAASSITRIFARLVVPTNKADNAKSGVVNISAAEKSAVLLLSDAVDDITTIDVSSFLSSGASVLIVDWAGDYGNKTRRTIYPSALSFADYDPIKSLCVTQNPKLSCWYIWAVTTLRALTFLESEGYKKNGIVGIGKGGSSVWKAASFDNSFCAACVVLDSGLEQLKQNVNSSADLLGFKACLDTANYASLLKCPMFMVTASNDSSGGFDYNLDIRNCVSRKDCLLLTLPLVDLSLYGKVRQNIKLFFDYYLKGNGTLPLSPSIKSGKSENNLYYQINTDPSDEVISCEIHTAYSSGLSAYRYWRNSVTERVSETEFIKKVPVYFVRDNVLAYSNIVYKNGFTASTNMVSTLPSSLGIEAAQAVRKRLIYDSEMGVEDFIIKESGGVTLKIEEGAYNINGAAFSGTLISYKIGDIMYRGDRGSVLQFIISSETVQNLEISLTDSKNGKEYFITRPISPENEWFKISVYANDFKCDVGSLDSFESVVMLKIRSKQKVLINSMLWV